MSDNKIKKTRRQWLYDQDVLMTKEANFPLEDMTEEADLFLKLYGCKQYLADCIANKGGTEFSDEERAEAMQDRFDNLCDDKFKLTHTESGFYFKDPDAVATKRGGIKQSALYDYFIADGHTHEQAIEAINKIKS